MCVLTKDIEPIEDLEEGLVNKHMLNTEKSLFTSDELHFPLGIGSWEDLPYFISQK